MKIRIMRMVEGMVSDSVVHRLIIGLFDYDGWLSFDIQINMPSTNQIVVHEALFFAFSRRQLGYASFLFFRYHRYHCRH